jgi:long-chain acyl-CoA synthetase
MINRSGLKVYPAKVEKVLRTHQGVADVAVIGRADPLHTEAVAAIIALHSPAHDPEGVAGELAALCREHLAPYEVPSRFEFTDRIPRSALGKLLKQELRRLPAPLPGPEETVTERRAA